MITLELDLGNFAHVVEKVALTNDFELKHCSRAEQVRVANLTTREMFSGWTREEKLEVFVLKRTDQNCSDKQWILINSGMEYICTK